jgi:hypothetical protein
MGAKGAESDDKDARFGGQFSQMYNTFSSSLYTIQVQFQLRVGLRLLAAFISQNPPENSQAWFRSFLRAGM